ncbi:MAG TPA: hypothetical protein VI386_26785 [Candidatus Sulfotelmatobacter sp.]
MIARGGHAGEILRQIRSLLALVFVSLLVLAPKARASATLLLEEPYGKLGFFTATGHAAVYLSGVCADSPLHLRACAQGETGIVLSRYNGVGGYDWIAVPLIPYLYAVDKAEDVPLFADAKMVAFLRDRYRREHLESVAPDLIDGGMPGGNWYELVGSSYDRTIYGYEIETSPERDAALIRKYNSSPNRSHFRTVSRNCADFAKDVINFYYPRSLHRSIVADVGITTPKQMAKNIVRLSEKHRDLHSESIIIPQVPGTAARSSHVHGVVESFFKSKKYIVPSAIVSPIFAGCVVAVYFGSSSGHFDPAKDALVYFPGRGSDERLGQEDRRAYEKELSHLIANEKESGATTHVKKAWERVQSNADLDFDQNGHPLLRVQVGDQDVDMGISASNVLSSSAPPLWKQQLLEARLQMELREKAPHAVSGDEITRDWILLKQVMQQGGEEIAQTGVSQIGARQIEAASRTRLSRVERNGGNAP